MCVYVVAQSCLTPGDPMDYSPPGSSVYEILQARILEWVVISFSRSPIGDIRIGRLKSKGAPQACSLSVFLFFVKASGCQIV